MKPEYQAISLLKNDTTHQFEITVDGYKAIIAFTESTQRISLDHTEIETALEGKGAATAVIEKTLVFIEKSGKKVLPHCALVFAYIKLHPTWKRIVDEDFRGFDA